MKMVVDLTPEQTDRLAEYCKRHGLSGEQALKDAVDKLLARSDPETARAAIRAAKGLWKDRDIDGVEYQRALRAEWDREWDPD